MLSGNFRSVIVSSQTRTNRKNKGFSFLSGKPEWKKAPLLRMKLSVRFAKDYFFDPSYNHLWLSCLPSTRISKLASLYGAWEGN
jgi:hypothetical protein